MSQNPAERQQSSPNHGPSSSNQRDRPTLPPIISTGQDPRNGSRRNSAGSQMSPAPNSAASANAESYSSRSLRMHSILNPSTGPDDLRPEPPRSANAAFPRSIPDHASAPTSSQTTPIRTLPPMAGLPPLGPGSHKSEPSGFPHRSLPPGTISLPTPTSDVRKSPFLTAAGTPQAGTPPVTGRASYPFPHQQATSGPDRRGSDAMATAPPSQSNSPTTSYSSYGHTTRNSPTPHYQQQQYYSNQPPNGPQITLGADSAFRAAPGTAMQSTYQMMTLDTDQGPIQVPVDVQAASKMADEKRKRNAGASARFRQRRKEKEREATQTISKLETKLRQVGEEKEYYRMERDYFRGLVYNSPAQVHVTPRLPSPKQRQPSEGSSNGTSEWQQSGERGSDDGRNQRRRISGFVEGPTAPAQPQPPPPQHQQPPSHYGPGPYQYPTADMRQQPSRPPMSGPLPQQNNPFNQPPPPHGYDRAWKPGQ